MPCWPFAGKTSVARTLAGLAGQELVELALNGGTDTSDLLGGFEQLEPGRRLQVSCPMMDAQSSRGISMYLSVHGACAFGPGTVQGA